VLLSCRLQNIKTRIKRSGKKEEYENRNEEKIACMMKEKR
jgi:hypothetical protein